MKHRNWIIPSCFLLAGLLMIALGIIGLVCAVTAQYFAAGAAVGFASRLRHAVMEHILGLSYSQIDQLGTSTLITRLTSDINQVQNAVNLTLRLLLRSPFVVFGAMIMAFTIDFDSALTFAVLIPVLCLVVFGIMLITMPMYKAVQGKLDAVTGATRQNLTGVRVLRAFTMEDSEVESFEKSTSDLQGKQQKAGRISNLMNPLTFVLVNLAVIVLIHIGALKVDGGILTQGLVVALYNYMSQILVELIKMANLIVSITKFIACGNRINAVMETEPSQTFPEELSAQPENDFALTFENVSFRYGAGATDSLTGLNFSVKKGETVGIIGGTGSGKTTLLSALLGLVPATERLLCVEDSPELRPAHPHVVRLVVRHGNVEGAGGVCATVEVNGYDWFVAGRPGAVDQAVDLLHG